MAASRPQAWGDGPVHDRPAHWQPPKLTPAQRDEIRQRLADGETARALALEYGVTRRTVHGL